MFPEIDRDVIDDVVRGNEGRIGNSVDTLLALGSS